MQSNSWRGRVYDGKKTHRSPPQWRNGFNGLVNGIAEDSNVSAKALLEKFGVGVSDDSPKIAKSLASITQMLFNKYRYDTICKEELKVPLTYLEEQRIRTSWLKILHTQLYKKIDFARRAESIRDHPYLMSFLEIIRKSPLTVNYNFDDTLERMLMNARDEKEQVRSRGYEVTDRPDGQFQRESAVIYHPNGFLPSIFEDGASAEVVFSDDTFQDRLISAATGKYVHLSNHLFRNTCLLIGLSLEDSTLQSLLRQNAVINPGHVHYMVYYLSSIANYDKVAMESIFYSNFSSYNLYTLFLDDVGIRELATLTTMSLPSFEAAFMDDEKKFVYYVVGSVGAGKSTAATNFRNLVTYDEWIDERKAILAVPDAEISPEQREEANEWVVEQFRKKNLALLQCDEGVHLVDRFPLDPLTFGTAEERPQKATNLIKKVMGQSKPIAPGHIIFLDSVLADLKVINSFKHKYWPDAEYQKLLVALEEVYGPIYKKTKVGTSGRGIGEVVREIARIIFLEEYKEVDLGAELARHAGEKA
jgi:hypothetical protein